MGKNAALAARAALGVLVKAARRSQRVSQFLKASHAGQESEVRAGEGPGRRNLSRL